MLLSVNTIEEKQSLYNFTENNIKNAILFTANVT